MPYTILFLITLGIFITIKITKTLALNMRMGKMLFNISSRFVNISDLDEVINSSLADLGRVNKVSRSYLFLLDQEHDTISNTHEWCANRVSTQKVNLQNISISLIPWWMEKLKSGEIIYIKNILDMPQDGTNEKELLESQGIKSLLAIPIYISDNLAGFIGFDDTTGPKKWSKINISMLKAFGKILGNALEKKDSKNTLSQKELILDTLFQQSLNPILVADAEGNFIDANKTALEFMECTKQELLQKKVWDDWLPERFSQQMEAHLPFVALKTAETYYSIKGQTKMLLLNIVPIQPNGKVMLYGIGQDITKLKNLEYVLKENEQYYKSLFEYNLDAVFAVDLKGNFTLVNPMAEKVSGYSPSEVLGKNFVDFLVPETIEGSLKVLAGVLAGQPQAIEAKIIHKTGKTIILSLMAVPIVINNQIIGCYGIGKDITATKEMEEQLKYMSYHDALTGIYNRGFFEREMERLEQQGYDNVGIIICDVNGLKIINDTLGHDAGDKLLSTAANCIKQATKGHHNVARIGGDEFALLLTDKDEEYVDNLCNDIRRVIEEYNLESPHLPLSLSVGFSLRHNPQTSLHELFIEADNNMYREKLNCANSARSDIVNAIMKILEARDIITTEHVTRLQALVSQTALALGLSEHKIKDIRLLAQFHDIGKIGISDSILNKPGPLTLDEYEEVKRHSDIGYKIINSVPNLNVIADLVRKHHEWWDGNGYPQGLKEDEIPIECRIFSIIDAYDVITSERPYKMALSHSEAIIELKRCAGTQFDPQLVGRFIKIMDEA